MDKKKTEDIFCFLNAIIFGIFWRPLTTREDTYFSPINYGLTSPLKIPMNKLS